MSIDERLPLYLIGKIASKIYMNIKIRKSIDKFIDRLGINVSSELHIGKPEMMLKSKSLNTKQISSMER